MSTAEARVAPPGAGAVVPVARPFAALRWFRSELGLVFRRPRNLVMLGVLALVPVVVGVALRIAQGEVSAEGGAFAQVTGNGLMLAFGAFAVMLPLFLPLAAAVVAGDSIAGEASRGTLRYLLVTPVSRTRLLVTKFAVIAVYCLAATATVAASASIAATVLFSPDGMTTLSGTVISGWEMIGRLALAALYLGLGLSALGAVGLALSTMTEAPIAAIAATVVLSVAAQILGAIPQLDVISPYLLTSAWSGFDAVLRDPMAVSDLRDGLLVFAAYIVIAGAVAWARFADRDITS
ncbi:ABC transporter permease [Bailinhaonella thermotolerans]|uniref:ABC transporter permease n=1 Tax=Bailinhaonella thermotolerans TaxID=1070861 RepID=A0A3A4AQL7_9ACTN|nr:ABC transporter permease [Bailinhaonella thermotolerans]RJL32026.1 ABC transporter permease [Bailinhaonella thermotolerans]